MLIANIVAGLPDQWEITDGGESNNYGYHAAVEAARADGLGISLTHKGGGITARFDDTHGYFSGYVSERGNLPEIRMSAKRPLAHLIGDVQRRLVAIIDVQAEAIITHNRRRIEAERRREYLLRTAQEMTGGTVDGNTLRSGGAFKLRTTGTNYNSMEIYGIDDETALAIIEILSQRR